MLCLRSKALDEESSCSSSSCSENPSISSFHRRRRSLVNDEGIHETGLHLAIGSITSKDSKINAPKRAKKMKSRKKLIPYFLFLQSCIAGFGLGMTEIFFPLFFKDKLDLSPVRVQIIFTIGKNLKNKNKDFVLSMFETCSLMAAIHAH